MRRYVHDIPKRVLGKLIFIGNVAVEVKRLTLPLLRAVAAADARREQGSRESLRMTPAIVESLQIIVKAIEGTAYKSWKRRAGPRGCFVMLRGSSVIATDGCGRGGLGGAQWTLASPSPETWAKPREEARSESSQSFELAAALEGLRRSSVRNGRLLFLVDNMGALAMLRRRVARSIIADSWVRDFWDLCAERSLHPTFLYVSSEENFVADALSREHVVSAGRVFRVLSSPDKLEKGPPEAAPDPHLREGFVYDGWGRSSHKRLESVLEWGYRLRGWQGPAANAVKACRLAFAENAPSCEINALSPLFSRRQELGHIFNLRTETSPAPEVDSPLLAAMEELATYTGAGATSHGTLGEGALLVKFRS